MQFKTHQKLIFFRLVERRGATVCIAHKDQYTLLDFNTGLLLNLFSFDPVQNDPFIKVPS